MTSIITYIKEWQQAIGIEIGFLKKYGSTKYRVTNGRILSNDKTFTYYFDTSTALRIPVGSSIRLEHGNVKQQGKVLSSEGRGIILELERSFGDLIYEAFLFHDPWELLDQLSQRLEEIKKNKQKRIRIKKLMDPSMNAKHPTDLIKSNVHELILRSKYNPITFVWGPPGTGKTYTLARVAANKYLKSKRVLILSHSNQAVDVLMQEITDFVIKKKQFREGDILRYGAQNLENISLSGSITTNSLLQKHDPLLAKDKEKLMEERRNLKMDISQSFSNRDSNRLLELETKIVHMLEKIRQKEIQFVEAAKVVGTTLAKAASDPTIYETNFDVVILDEASMAYVPQAAFAASLGKHVIICGDFKQLPPIAAARHELVNKWLKEDIFHRAGVVESVNNRQLHPHLFLLKEQRRMHPDISAFTNHYIYKSLVGDHVSVHKSRNRLVASQPFPNHASILLDTSYTGEHCITERSSKSRMNPWQLLLSFQLIHEAYLDGFRSIGFVTPYRAQAVLMELLLNDLYQAELQQSDIISATVHRFQGSERDVMIFDTVDSFPQDRAGMLLTGKDSERLINVAITRTKGKFIHISDRAFMKKYVFRGKILRNLLEHQERNNQTVSQKEIGTWIRHQHPRLQWIHARKLESVFQDLQNAKKSITFSLPEGTQLSEEWKKQIGKQRKGVKLSIISSNNCFDLRHITWIKEHIPFPFVIIDQRFLWLGIPLEASKRTNPPYVAARLDSENVVQHFLDQLPL